MIELVDKNITTIIITVVDMSQQKRNTEDVKERYGKHACTRAQSCLTLCNPMDCSPAGSSVHEVSQARILEWVAISSSRDIPDPGIDLSLLHTRILHYLSHWGSPW